MSYHSLQVLLRWRKASCSQFKTWHHQLKGGNVGSIESSKKKPHKLERCQIFLLKYWPHLCLPPLTFSCSSLTLSSAFTCRPPKLILPPFKACFMKLILKAPRCHISCVSLSAALSFHFSFCIFFTATEKNLTFTVQCLPSQMREEKSRSTSFFPFKYLVSVLVLSGV